MAARGYPSMTLPNMNLTALSENATRLGMRLQESISERTREFGLQSLSSGRGMVSFIATLQMILNDAKKERRV